MLPALLFGLLNFTAKKQPPTLHVARSTLYGKCMLVYVLFAVFAMVAHWHSSIASLETAGQRHVHRCIHKCKVTYPTTFKIVAGK